MVLSKADTSHLDKVEVSDLGFLPEYNSLSKASALKVNAALRKFFAFLLQGKRQKPLATHPSCLESYRLENVFKNRVRQSFLARENLTQTY